MEMDSVQLNSILARMRLMSDEDGQVMVSTNPSVMCGGEISPAAFAKAIMDDGEFIAVGAFGDPDQSIFLFSRVDAS